MVRAIAIGNQNFEQLIKSHAFYVDKTLFLSEWYKSLDSITLITRPRRFGKTLTLNMTERFFSLKYAGQSDLFKGLDIYNDKDMMKLQGAFPVISLSFANIKSIDYPSFVIEMSAVIRQVYRSYEYLLDSTDISEVNKKEIKRMIEIPENSKSRDYPLTVSEISNSLNRLSEILNQAYGRNVYILLDEYDTPLVESFTHGYWDQASQLIRSMFNSSFKTNAYLDRAIMTGITRVAKESIFSDLNNLAVYSVTRNQYADKFGFTEQEVFDALDEYGLSDEKENVKYWYDGFTFGRTRDIYNPWSITNYLKNQEYLCYWANTSSNSLISSLVWNGSPDIKQQFGKLMQGETIQAEIDDEIVFNQLSYNTKLIWSLLLAAGYVKGEKLQGKTYLLSLTNHEVRDSFEEMVRNWFNTEKSGYDGFIRALLRCDTEEMTYLLRDTLASVTSFYDGGKEESEQNPEKFYHGLVLGMIVTLKNRYAITSNRESGYGRYDILMKPLNDTDPAFVIEFKVKSDTEKDPEETAQRALKQIREKEYVTALLNENISPERIHCLGMGFAGKSVFITEEMK
ncbi:MAG: hypothetical protein E7190_10025 [Erysipelotrichaceae bacterium]|nr:hypothetical protein [Erysipelotrichaceae bacterium]